MTAPARLAALTAASLPAPDARHWRREMERAIATGHTAAWIAGTSERLGTRTINPRNLSRAERAELKAVIAAQLQYLDGFDRTGMSEAQIAARANLYPGATRTTYYEARWGDWDIPGELMPGNQECITQCKCEISVKDNGDGTGVLTRTMHAEAHCTECPPLAGDHPVKRKGVALKHMRGAHDQRSHGRRGGGGRRGGAEPTSPDIQRKLQSIDSELASRFVSPGRRQLLEEQRRELTSAAPPTTPSAPMADTANSNAQRRLQDIDAELAGRYVSPGRRQELERQREEIAGTTRPSGSPLMRELDAAEAEVRGLPYEKAVFFSADGRRLVQVTGDAKSYRLSEQQFNSLRGAGATMTHNHPSGHKYPPGHPRHRGDSFSLADVQQAAALGLVEVRAVTPTRRYWMKPPTGGWKEHHWQKTVPDSYRKHHASVLADMVQQVRTGRISQDEANARFYHEVWRRVATDIGASYGYDDR